MSASVNDKIVDIRNAARPVTTTVSSGRAALGSSLACVSLTGWPTASKVHFVTYKIDSNSNPVAGTQLDCQGIVSGNTINSFSVIDGTDTGNSIGDVVEMLPTAAWGQDLADALTSTHNRSGGLKSGLTIASPTITIPVITDFTSANHTHASTAQGGAISNVLMSNPYKFSVYRNAALTMTSNPLIFDTKLFDTSNNYNTTTGLFTAPIAGFYQITIQLTANFASTGRAISPILVKNGSTQLYQSIWVSTYNSLFSESGYLYPPPVQLAVGDTLQVNSGDIANLPIVVGLPAATFFGGFLVSAI